MPKFYDLQLVFGLGKLLFHALDLVQIYIIQVSSTYQIKEVVSLINKKDS